MRPEEFTYDEQRRFAIAAKILHISIEAPRNDIQIRLQHFASSLDRPADPSDQRETDRISEPIILLNITGCGSSIGSSYEMRAVGSSS